MPRADSDFFVPPAHHKILLFAPGGGGNADIKLRMERYQRGSPSLPTWVYSKRKKIGFLLTPILRYDKSTRQNLPAPQTINQIRSHS